MARLAGMNEERRVPALARVEATLWPTWPDLPIPVTMTRPGRERMSSQARTKSSSIRGSSPRRASISVRMTSVPSRRRVVLLMAWEGVRAKDGAGASYRK